MSKRHFGTIVASVTAVAVACVLAVVIVALPQSAPDSGASGAGQGDTSNADVPSEVATPATAAESATEDVADDPTQLEPGSVLATLATGTTPEAALESLSSITGLDGISIAKASDDIVKFKLPDGMTVAKATSLIENAPGIASAQPNFRYYLTDEPQVSADASSLTGASLSAADGEDEATPDVKANDPYRSEQWALNSMKAPGAWNTVTSTATSSKYVTVAVLDSGFRKGHEDLKNVIVKTYNAANPGSDIFGDEDIAEHGTHVAGIIAAQANNGKGIAGVAYNTSKYATCKLLPIRVTEDNGGIYTDTLVNAYKWLKKVHSTYNVRVVNMSLGGDRGDPKYEGDVLVEKQMNALWKLGVVTVAAGGNINDWYTDTPFVTYPSDSPNVVGVINLSQSTNSDGVKRDSSSNFNTKKQKKKDISAPGTDILSAYSSSNQSYTTMTGTSMASPAVAGALALVFRANPKLTPAEATSKLFSSAKDLTQCSGTKKGWDCYTGYGEVNVAAAVSAKTPYLSGNTLLRAGQNTQLTVKINNKKKAARSWKWTTSSTKIAKVTSTGKVIAKAKGDVIITAKNGKQVARQTLTIRK